jgi:hypothetical protein
MPYFRAQPIALRKYLGSYENQKIYEASKHALPGRLFQKSLSVPRLDGPVRDRYANVVEACTGDLGKVLLGLWFL